MTHVLKMETALVLGIPPEFVLFGCLSLNVLKNVLVL